VTEEKLRNAERDAKKVNTLESLLEEERRQRADTGNQITRLEQERRKLELRNNDAGRNNEELSNKVIKYDSEISHLKSKVRYEIIRIYHKK
jgi:chromosome segregation ATPase